MSNLEKINENGPYPLPNQALYQAKLRPDMFAYNDLQD
jgi:hypothetical protein